MTDWIEVAERSEAWVPRDRWTEDDVAELLQRYGSAAGYLDVGWPNPLNGQRYHLRAFDTVGSLPLPGGGGVRVVPKVATDHVLRLLEVAYDVPVRFLAGEAPVATIDDLFDRLTARLAHLVIARVRRGLVKEYRGHEERLPYVRGRIDSNGFVARAEPTAFDCTFDEHTSDVHDNRVLRWTLHHVGRSPTLQPTTRRHVARALYALGPDVALRAVTPAAALQATYDRLRNDYRPMHLLCRLLLENAGPTTRSGDRDLTPLVVHMPTLFERLVATVLGPRLPSNLVLKTHEKTDLVGTHGVRLDIDLVVRDRATGAARLVLDTKYKDVAAPSKDDFNQAVTYAVSLGAPVAVLVYPTEAAPYVVQAGGVVVHRIGFRFDGILDDEVAALAARAVRLAEPRGASEPTS
jgi:5-methylcytosine-specific restriction enzyme subunit McrC